MRGVYSRNWRYMGKNSGGRVWVKFLIQLSRFYKLQCTNLPPDHGCKKHIFVYYAELVARLCIRDKSKDDGKKAHKTKWIIDARQYINFAFEDRRRFFGVFSVVDQSGRRVVRHIHFADDPLLQPRSVVLRFISHTKNSL